MNTLTKILLVEDSNFDSTTIVELLKEENYSIEVVNDGLKAINYLKKCQHATDLPALVLSDIFMPNMNGFELCSELREHYKDIPCIMLTAYNDEDNLTRAFKAGAFDYLIKPCTKTELIVRVEKVLRLHHMISNMETELEMLQVKKQEMASIVEQCQDFVAITSLDSKVLYVNRGGLEIVGLDDNTKAREKSMYDLIYPEDGNSVKELISKSDAAMYEAKRKKNNSYHFYNKLILQNI